ncbi:MAG: polysaccharide deacetylase family protein [Planctomycetota bacterium]|jgi:polysaccharide deacetylase family protein (PEP-CTERM system associated)
MINILTLDVEDYWSVFSRDWLGKDIEPTDAVANNTEMFLEMFARFGVKSTCFILADVAKKCPGLIRKIAQGGHEIASHGLSHSQIFKLSSKQFQSEMADSKKLLEDIVGAPVVGHRAPAFSIMPETQWALEVLAGEGFQYDSSIFPISGARYGWPGFSRDICKIKLPSGLEIIEVPLSTVKVFSKTFPAAGGGYIRHFPYIVTKCAIKSIQRKRPAVVYMHPYEIDTKEISFDVESLSCEEKNKVLRFHRTQKRNRDTVCKKLFNILSDFEFASVKEVIDKTDVKMFEGTL